MLWWTNTVCHLFYSALPLKLILDRIDGIDIATIGLEDLRTRIVRV